MNGRGVLPLPGFASAKQLAKYHSFDFTNARDEPANYLELAYSNKASTQSIYSQTVTDAAAKQQALDNMPTVRASLKEHVVSSVAVTTPSHTETMRKFVALHEEMERAFLSEPPEYKAAWGKVLSMMHTRIFQLPAEIEALQEKQELVMEAQEIALARETADDKKKKKSKLDAKREQAQASASTAALTPPSSAQQKRLQGPRS